MRYFDTWTAFLVMLFMLVGLCGLFASYAAGIPLERGIARSALLDRALAASPAELAAMRPTLGSLAAAVIDGPAPLPDRIARARLVVADEQRREAASVDYRTRLMLGVVTLLAAGLGAGIMAIARRGAAQQAAEPARAA